jgi:hypothetical protein
MVQDKRSSTLKVSSLDLISIEQEIKFLCCKFGYVTKLLTSDENLLFQFESNLFQFESNLTISSL